MPGLATRFALLLAGLRAAIAPVAARDHARTGLLVLLWARLARTAIRFERLFTRWRDGTLPRPRVIRPRVARPHATRPTGFAAPRPAAPRLPAGHAWLLRQLREAAPAASQLRHFLATPELAAFLAAAPQASRLLRPLCRMLGVTPPAPPIPVPAAIPAPASTTPEPAPRHPPASPPPRPPRAEPRQPGPVPTILLELFPPL